MFEDKLQYQLNKIKVQAHTLDKIQWLVNNVLY
jgi:hypothetical protein